MCFTILDAQIINIRRSTIIDIESEFESNETKLQKLSQDLVQLNCEMKIHLEVLDEKTNYHRTCMTGGTWEPSKSCSCTDGNLEPDCVPFQGSGSAVIDQPNAISSQNKNSSNFCF